MKNAILGPLLLLGAGVLAAPVLPVLAQDAAPVATPYVMPDTEVWDMPAAHGQTYRIYVSRPAGEVPEGGYPVLYVLDGNAMFAGFAEARRIQGVYSQGLDKMIVVAIGYPNDLPYDPRRMGDFTAPIAHPVLKALYKDHPSGGRDRFLSFLMDRVRPEIARRYGVNPLRQSLYGHSLGGLFALHVLYSRPGAFHTIIAASPSIWWDDQAILAEERAFRARLEKEPALASGSRLLILAGEREETPVSLTDSIALGKRLEPLSALGLRSSHMVLDGETHITVPSRSVTTALRAAMQWP
ncbi:alpha/beta hydrolase [Niveispirillum fermenti]|uniref:alpha/beta hydrolase n=1 Tax=Niveispirillum fermenti TaxID=1233113 RepID=UPI003A83E77A